MAEFVVNTVQLNNCATQIASLQRELDSVALRLAGMQLGSVLQMRASASLIARVGDCKWAAVHQSDNLGKLARGLEDVAGLYERYETNLTEPQTQAQAESGESSEAEGEDMSFWEALWETFPFLECIGTGIEAVGRLVYGLGDIFATGISAVMSVIGSGIDNVAEFAGELFSEQFWFEFLGEAAVDFAMGFGASAAIVAVLGVTPVGWGAVAVAAGAAAICWLGDAVCTWITGDDISELIVDGLWAVNEWIETGVDHVVDIAGDVIDAAGDMIDAAGEVVDQAFDTIQDGAVAMWNGACEFVDTLLPW